jgi:hypothetical protein
MRELDYVWSSNGTAGAQTAVRVIGDPLHSAFYFKASTGVATATVTVESALSSGGPWFTEAASTALSSGECLVLRITGPLGFVRPTCGSTGITVRAIGVR